MDTQDNKIELNFTKPKITEQEMEVELAGFNERFIAYLIDTLPFVFLNYYTLTVAIQKNIVEYSNAISAKWKIFWALLFIIYEVIFTSGGRVTLGKKIIGIKVIRTDGANLNFFNALMRAMGYFISSFTINIGYLMALFTKNKRALHDYLASSIVIKTKEKPAFVEGLILAISWVIMLFFTVSWLNRTILNITPAERELIYKAKITVWKLARLEEIYKQKYGRYTDDIKELAQLTGNINAVRYELAQTITEGSLEITTTNNKDGYIISAKAKNWRKTKVEIAGGSFKKQ